MNFKKTFIPSFEKSNINICYYHYNLLDELFSCFNEMGLIKNDEFSIKFNRMIFKYITFQDFVFYRDELRLLCKDRGTEIYKKMFGLLKSLENDLLLKSIRDKYDLNSSIFLALNSEHGDYFSSKVENIDFILISDLKNYYYKNNIISFLPINFFKNLFLLPSSPSYILVQYYKWRCSDFDLSLYDLKYDSLYLDDCFLDDALIGEVEKEKYSIDNVFFENKNTENFKEYIIINNELNVYKARIVDGKKYFSNYYVEDIDYDKFTQSGLKKLRYLKMKKWKDGLAKERNIHRLCNLLTHYGAEKANIINVKNWMREDTIAPELDKDFIAVLKYCGIDSENEIKNYFEVARVLRSDSISQGHINKDIVYDLIIEYLNDHKEELTEICQSEKHDLSGILFSLRRGYF